MHETNIMRSFMFLLPLKQGVLALIETFMFVIDSIWQMTGKCRQIKYLLTEAVAEICSAAAFFITKFGLLTDLIM